MKANRLLALCLLLILTLTNAVGIKAITTIGNITYEFNQNNNTASVVRTTLMAYDDVDLIIIPPSVKYTNTTYTVTEIRSRAFYGLYNLHSVEFPSTLQTIGENAFQNCTGLTEISLPSSVTTLESNAFSGCSNIKKVECNAPNPPYCGGSVNPFSEETLSYGVLSVPRGSVESYKQASGWSHFKTVRYIGQVDPTSISMDKSKTMNINTTWRLNATLSPANTTETDIAWSSSNPSVVEVNNGTLIAKSPGNANITARTTNGLTATCSVTVMVPVTSLKADPVGDMHVGDTRQLVVTVLPANATDKTLQYLSTAPDCVSADSNGRLTAKALGSAEIIITAGSGVNTRVTVQVIPTPVSSISMVGSMAMYIGESKQIQPVIYPANATDKSLRWESSNANVAYVDGFGNVKALTEGTADIKATTHNGKTAITHVSVSPVMVSSVSLSKTDLDLAVEQTATLIATVLPENATDKNITWSSSDETVCSVSGNGRMTAKSVGSAIITATSGNGITATCRVDVSIPVTAIEIDYAGMGLPGTVAELKAGEQLKIIAGVVPSDATYPALKFESSSPDKASVGEDGTITANSVGNTIITLTATSGVKTILNVKEIPTLAEDILLDAEELSMQVGDSQKISAVISPATTTDKTIIWNSSDTSVASVDKDGNVTALSIGETTITATTSNGLTAACSVKVIPTKAESITIAPSTLELEVNSTADLKAIVLPENTTDKSVEWKSSDEAIATVDGNGVVTAVAEGSAVITAMTLDGTFLIAKCDVLVLPESGVNAILMEDDVKIFTLSGLPVSKDATLLPGIYMIRRGGKIMKIVIR